MHQANNKTTENGSEGTNLNVSMNVINFLLYIIITVMPSLRHMDTNGVWSLFPVEKRPQIHVTSANFGNFVHGCPRYNRYAIYHIWWGCQDWSLRAWFKSSLSRFFSPFA